MAENDQQSYRELLAQAQAAYLHLRLDEALRCYRAAEAARPDSCEAQLGLSRTFGRLGRVEEARAAARRCIELAPARFEGYASLGTLHWLTDENDQAIVALQQAVDLAPEEADPRLALAQVYADTGRLEAARAELETARDLAAVIEDDVLRNSTLAFAWHVKSYLSMAEGDDTGAMEAAQRTVELEDANPYAASLALSNLGLLHARARRYAEAIECMERARQMNPFLRQVAGALGRLLLVSQQYERAAQVLAEATENALRDAGSTRHAYATALAKVGRREGARTQYRRALGEGLGGPGALIARWQVFWLSTWGRYALLGVVVAGVLVWVLLGEPSPAALTLIALAALILFLQARFGRRRP